MTWAARLVLLVAIIATGCGRSPRQVARDAAVSTFRVIDAPANYVRRKIDERDAETQVTTTTTTTEAAVGSSDVVTPGRPLPPRQPGGPAVQPNAGSNAVAGATQRPPRRDTANVTPPPPRTTPPATAEQFPTARPVPDKPGFVYSVDPKGGIIDVTGYQSGDKAKDPYTKQIFIVP